MFGLASPWLIVGALVGTIALGGGAYWKGWNDRAARCDTLIAEQKLADQAARQTAIDETAAKSATKIEQLTTDLAVERGKSHEIIKQVVRTVRVQVPDVDSCAVGGDVYQRVFNDTGRLTHNLVPAPARREPDDEGPRPPSP